MQKHNLTKFLSHPIVVEHRALGTLYSPAAYSDTTNIANNSFNVAVL